MSWVATLTTISYVLTTARSQSRLPDDGQAPDPYPGRLEAFASASDYRSWQQHRQRSRSENKLEPHTVAQIVLTAATFSVLVLGIACYACHSKRVSTRRRRAGRYDKLEGTSTPDGQRQVLRLSPVGAAARMNRDNWASISLVNLLNSYPSSSTSGSRDGANLATVTDTT